MENNIVLYCLVLNVILDNASRFESDIRLAIFASNKIKYLLQEKHLIQCQALKSCIKNSCFDKIHSINARNYAMHSLNFPNCKVIYLNVM